MEVYDWPANRFVAGFIGTPAMNFIDGQPGARRRRAERFQPRLAASAARASELARGLRPCATAGRARVCGPKHLRLADAGGPMAIEGAVAVVELLGDATIGHGGTGLRPSRPPTEAALAMSTKRPAVA